jgi:hypothetical protein
VGSAIAVVVLGEVVVVVVGRVVVVVLVAVVVVVFEVDVQAAAARTSTITNA